MTHSLWALLAYAAWTLVLALAVVTWRGWLIRHARFRINDFPSGAKHGPDVYWRLNRAHANALENLPIFAAIVLTAKVAGLAPAYFGCLAVVVPCARVAQSTFHVAGNTAATVTLRFFGFFTQWLAMAAMTVLLACAACR